MDEKRKQEVASRLREIIPQGLVGGVGRGEPGSLCVEAAISFALGEPHGDKPSCVAAADRAFAIRINDAAWSSKAARAEALLPLALAQLGTAGTDREAWVRRVVEGTIRRVVPLALRHAARAVPSHAERLEAAAARCEVEGTKDAAKAAVRVADAAYAAAYARAAYDAYDAAAYARAAADVAASDAAAHAARAARAAYAAARAADAAAHAYDAARAAKAAAVDGDEALRVSVQVALDAYAVEGRV